MNEDVFKFCPKCGSEQFAFATPKSLLCENCQFEYYFNPCGAAVGIIRDEESRILLTRRALNPQAGMLDLPGGFIDFHETAEEALQRELNEELDIKIRAITYFCSMPNIYHYSGVEYHTIDMFFICDPLNLDDLKAQDEITAFYFKKLDEIDFREIGFDSIKGGLSFLKEEVDAGRFQL